MRHRRTTVFRERAEHRIRDDDLTRTTAGVIVRDVIALSDERRAGSSHAVLAAVVGEDRVLDYHPAGRAQRSQSIPRVVRDGAVGYDDERAEHGRERKCRLILERGT